MTLSVFYDFETSDRFFLSQILSYSFIAVDDSLAIVKEMSGTIHLSRLQLPAREALLTNRIDILKHQAAASRDECETALEIRNFLDALCRENRQKLPLIGYNSSRFDLQFLRTTLMRNGINPYFENRLAYRDVLHAVKKLQALESDFPRPIAPETLHTGEPRLSLGLENISRELGILKAPQSHDARQDVLLTIDLAREIKERFGLDVCRYDGYEADFAEQTAGRGQVFMALEGNYDLRSPQRCVERPLSLLASDHRGALWIDLKRFKEGAGRGSVNYVTKSTGTLIVQPEPVRDPAWTQTAAEASREFAGLNTRNFFQTSLCDIEQDIYRLDPAAIDALYEAIWLDRPARLETSGNRDARVIFTRNRLARFKQSLNQNAGMNKKLKDYGLYRYGGNALLWRTEPSEGKARPEAWHWKLSDALREIEAILPKLGPADAAILESLREFYLSSEIYQLCAESLAP